MILNTSRAQGFQECRQKDFNWDELHLLPHREADPLVIGEAYHLGSEWITKYGDIDEAVKAAEDRFRTRMKNQLILPEEVVGIERNIEFVKHAIREFGQYYDKAEFKVLWPEVNGMVPLPNTLHHCWFCHRLLCPSIPFDQCVNASGGFYDSEGNIHPQAPKCAQPHFFKFRTDGIIELYRKVWLLEQKTTSSTDRNHFWDKWQMEFQTRMYVYGVWKVTGMLPTGFLLNAIIKHSKQHTIGGVRKYELDPTNVGFEREYYTVTEEELGDFEHDFILIAEERERAFRDHIIYKNTKSCFDYNRACYYWDLCKRRQSPLEGEFRHRDPDYVELSYYDLLGLTPPPPSPLNILTSQQETQNVEE